MTRMRHRPPAMPSHLQTVAQGHSPNHLVIILESQKLTFLSETVALVI
jgi:hypothetical protein